MLRVKPHYFGPVESEMLEFFYRQFFKPLLDVVNIPMKKLNANSALIDAIRSGRVQYDTGVFRGSFNARISAELAKFATFDKRFGTWKGRPAPDVLAVAVIARSKRDDMIAQLQSQLDDIESSVNDAIQSLALGNDLPLFAMTDDIRSDLYSIGVMPDISERMATKLRQDYTDSQQLNIKNWTPDQIVRLREMIERIQTTNDNSSIIQIIQDEWGTTAAKARFLARQETSLFFSTLSMNRAQASGVRRYRWSTSHDIRVRESHKELDGTIQMIGFPPVVDHKTGRRAEPGQDFNCRCAPIWILE